MANQFSALKDLISQFTYKGWKISDKYEFVSNQYQELKWDTLDVSTTVVELHFKITGKSKPDVSGTIQQLTSLVSDEFLIYEPIKDTCTYLPKPDLAYLMHTWSELMQAFFSLQQKFESFGVELVKPTMPQFYDTQVVGCESDIILHIHYFHPLFKHFTHPAKALM